MSREYSSTISAIDRLLAILESSSPEVAQYEPKIRRAYTLLTEKGGTIPEDLETYVEYFGTTTDIPDWVKQRSAILQLRAKAAQFSSKFIKDLKIISKDLRAVFPFLIYLFLIFRNNEVPEKGTDLSHEILDFIREIRQKSPKSEPDPTEDIKGLPEEIEILQLFSPLSATWILLGVQSLQELDGNPCDSAMRMKGEAAASCQRILDADKKEKVMETLELTEFITLLAGERRLVLLQENRVFTLEPKGKKDEKITSELKILALAVFLFFYSTLEHTQTNAVVFLDKFLGKLGYTWNGKDAYIQTESFGRIPVESHQRPVNFAGGKKRVLQ